MSQIGINFNFNKSSMKKGNFFSLSKLCYIQELKNQGSHKFHHLPLLHLLVGFSNVFFLIFIFL